VNPRYQELTKLFHDIHGILKQIGRKGYEGMGFTMPQGLVIRILMSKTPCKISDLSEELKLSNSTVSGIVDRLERQGVAVRERDERDRRIVYVRLTDAFGEMHRNFHKKMEESAKKFMSNIDSKDFEAILKGLRTLHKYLLRYESVLHNTKK